MKALAIWGLMLCLLAYPTYAGSDANAFTKSHLISYGSDFSAAKTISNNEISTPDLNFKSEGEVITEITMNEGGISEIYQNLYFSAGRYRGFSGYGSASSSYSGRNVKELKSEISGTATTTVSHTHDITRVKSTSTGAAMASPGTEEYEFSISGGHNTVTDAAVYSIPKWMIDRPDMVINFSLQTDAIEWDEGMDVVDQDIMFDYGISNYQLAFYSYDYSSTLQLGDTTCECEMEFFNGDGA